MFYKIVNTLIWNHELNAQNKKRRIEFFLISLNPKKTLTHFIHSPEWISSTDQEATRLRNDTVSTSRKPSPTSNTTSRLSSPTALLPSRPTSNRRSLRRRRRGPGSPPGAQPETGSPAQRRRVRRRVGWPCRRRRLRRGWRACRCTRSATETRSSCSSPASQQTSRSDCSASIKTTPKLFSTRFRLSILPCSPAPRSSPLLSIRLVDFLF